MTSVVETAKNSNTKIDIESSIKKKLCCLFNALVRSNETFVNELFSDILSDLRPIIEQDDYQKFYLMKIVVKIMYYCRDHVLGKGERDLFYSMIFTFYQQLPEYAIQIIKQLPMSEGTQGSIGCWRDIPKICTYIRNNSTEREDHPLITVLVKYMNRQFANDLILWGNMRKNDEKRKTFPKYTFSLVAKWIPRERVNTEWLFSKFVVDWYITNDYDKLAHVKHTSSYVFALKKCKMNYRKIVSLFNRFLDTNEIHQCANKWGNIVPENVNRCTVQKQFDMFFPKNSMGGSTDRLSIVNDVCLANHEITKERETFDKKFYDYFHKFITREKKAHATPSGCDLNRQRCKEELETTMQLNENTNLTIRDKDKKYSCRFNDLSMHGFASRAIKIINERKKMDKIGDKTSDQPDLFYKDTIGYIQKQKTLEMKIQYLNKEWDEFSEDIKANHCVPVICVNYSMQYDHLAMACLYAKQSKRVMILHTATDVTDTNENFIARSFVDLSDKNNFVDMIEKLYLESNSAISFPTSEKTKPGFRSVENLSGDFTHEIQALFSIIECFLTSNRMNGKSRADFGKLIFISNVNIFRTLHNTYMKLSEDHRKLFSLIIFHYIGDARELNLKNSEDVINMNNNLDKEIIIVSGAKKSISKYVSNYSFCNNYDMMTHMLNIYA